MSPKRRTGGRPVGETIGGILAGFDQQIMRTTPPPHELVQKGQPVRGLSGEDGDDLVIVLTDPLEPVAERDDDDASDPAG